MLPEEERELMLKGGHPEDDHRDDLDGKKKSYARATRAIEGSLRKSEGGGNGK